MTNSLIEAVAQIRIMIRSAVEEDCRAWELTDSELAVVAEAAITAITPVIRREALEEAAKVAETFALPFSEREDTYIAAAIRALKEKDYR